MKYWKWKKSATSKLKQIIEKRVLIFVPSGNIAATNLSIPFVFIHFQNSLLKSWGMQLREETTTHQRQKKNERKKKSTMLEEWTGIKLINNLMKQIIIVIYYKYKTYLYIINWITEFIFHKYLQHLYYKFSSNIFSVTITTVG